MKRNVTTVRVNGTVVPWLVKPRPGSLIGCDLGTITVTLPTWNLTAQAIPYVLQLELNSNSYRDSTHSIFVNAFLSATPVPSLSSVVMTNAHTQLVAGSMVDFVVTPIDAAGVVILGMSNQAYLGTLAHLASNMSVTCRVVFDTSTGEQIGTCGIPNTLYNTDLQ